MEKPVAVDAMGAKRVIAAAQEAKKKKLNVCVGFQRRYQPGYIDMIEAHPCGGDRRPRLRPCVLERHLASRLPA
jgi:hypothetical protein